MKILLITILIGLALFGCTPNEMNGDDSLNKVTMSQNDIESPTSKYENILFNEATFDESLYREPDFFTPFVGEIQSSGDLPPIPFDAFIENDVNVIARVKITDNYGGFDFYQRWPLEGSPLTTVWTKNEAIVIDVYYGEEIAGNQIEILQLGGIYENMLHDYTGFFEELEVGSEYLIFALDILNHPSPLITESKSNLNTYFIVSPFDGYFKIINEKVSINKHVAAYSHFKSNIDISAMVPYVNEQMTNIHPSN